MAKIRIKSVNASTFRGWTFVLLLGAILAVVALVDRGGLDEAASTGATGCRLEVVADQLNVRSGPGPEAALVATLTRGATVDGTTVVRNGFRELSEARWAADQFLTPLPGTDCT